MEYTNKTEYQVGKSNKILLPRLGRAGKVGQDRKRQGRAGQGRAGQCRARQCSALHSSAGKDRKNIARGKYVWMGQVKDE